MSENDIKPVAWTINESLEKVAAGQIGFIAPREKITPAADVPLYDQSAIDRLTAERDAAVADAERYRAVIVYALAQHNYGGHPLQNHWAAHAQNELAAIDAARAEGGV